MGWMVQALIHKEKEGKWLASLGFKLGPPYYDVCE